MRTRLVVFDLDGTLIDSRRDLADSANEMLAGYGAPPLAEARVAGMVGSGAATLVARVLAASGVEARPEEALPRFLSCYDRRLTRHTRPYDGVPGLLDQLRDARVAMAILTNKPLAQSVTILETFDFLQYFPWIVGGDGPWPRKPSPDGLQFLLGQAAVEAGEALMVGDSTIDLQTSRNAGVAICLARYGFGYADLPLSDLRGDEAIVERPGDIVDLLHAR